MQYVYGSDAAAVVREGPLPAARAERIIAETAKALDFAHAADVLHRDVKPANILLTRSIAGEPERVLLADFGIAKALDDRAGLTATGMFAGSLQYAAPEQFNPSVTLDARADEYALGCSLYYLLTGSVPYPGGRHTSSLCGPTSTRRCSGPGNDQRPAGHGPVAMVPGSDH